MASEQSPAEPLQILIVEDNPLIRDLFVHAIHRLRSEIPDCPPIEITEVEDGATALDRLEQKRVDLLVVDLYLPILGGIELIKRIRDDPKLAALRILAMSASFTDARDRSLGAGADIFLQKPLLLVDVLESFRTLLRRRL